MIVKRADEDRVDVRLVFDPSETALAEAVAQRLADAGLAAGLSPAEVEPGENFPATVRRAAETTRAMAFLMSPAGIANQVLHVFAGAAWANDLPMFVLRNRVRPSDYDPFFKRFPAYPLWTGFPRLVRDIDRVADRAPA
jgi:hypothetical protein